MYFNDLSNNDISFIIKKIASSKINMLYGWESQIKSNIL